MQNPPGTGKRATIFESPRSHKTVHLGSASETASSVPLSPSTNHTKIESGSSISEPDLSVDSAVHDSGTISNDVSSSSTLMSDPVSFYS